jgi:hypothetical protein
MDLHARNVVRDEELPPFLVDGDAIGEQMEFFLEIPCQPVRLLRRKAIAITMKRAGAGIPEFSDVLRCIAKY